MIERDEIQSLRFNVKPPAPEQPTPPGPFNLYDNPVFIKWHAETMQMMMQAQGAEEIVAMIDMRPPRRAEIDVVSLEEIRVVLVERAPHMAEDES